MRKYWIILIILLCLVPTNCIRAQTTNAGFIPGNIWYSIDPFEEGDKIKIYTVVFNPDPRELYGTVIFFDNTVFLGKKDFIVSAKGVRDVSLDWVATPGIHSIFGKIENAKFLISKDKYEDVYLAENETNKSSRTVNKKITINNETISKNTDSILGGVSDFGSNSIKGIENAITTKTPDFIAKPIVLGASTLENFRKDVGSVSKNKANTAQDQIKYSNIGANAKQSSKKIETSAFLKPFKYIELFFFTFLSFIFNNKFIFYGILIILIFVILRYIWHLIFK
ncbi:MAG: hypothetical protein WCP17_01715 [bacterium]